MESKRVFPLKNMIGFGEDIPSSMIRINTSIKFLLFLTDVVKIWDAVSAYIESYMKQSKVTKNSSTFHSKIIH
jgi:hypothetical protein